MHANETGPGAMIGAMVSAVKQSRQELRDRITEVRYGPIVGEVGYMLFNLDNTPMQARMVGPIVDNVLGFGEHLDKEVAALSLLHNLATPANESEQ
jgi:hypothetical protein